MFSKMAATAGLALTLLVCGGAARACEGDDCPAPAESTAKPIDIKKFMREQAASTRAGERKSSSQTAKPKSAATKSAATKPAAAKRAASRTVAAQPKPARQEPAPLPNAAAASFASQGERAGPVVASEFNAIDNTAQPPFPETTGAAPAAGPDVQLVAAAELNDIDRKADEAAPPPAPTALADAPAKVDIAPAPAPVAQVSWLGWLWSVVTGTFAALATAVRQLVHL